MPPPAGSVESWGWMEVCWRWCWGRVKEEVSMAPSMVGTALVVVVVVVMQLPRVCFRCKWLGDWLFQVFLSGFIEKAWLLRNSGEVWFGQWRFGRDTNRFFLIFCFLLQSLAEFWQVSYVNSDILFLFLYIQWLSGWYSSVVFTNLCSYKPKGFTKVSWISLPPPSLSFLLSFTIIRWSWQVF